MSTVEVADSSQNLTQLTGDGGLACTRVTRQDDVHGHLLLLTQSTFCTLDTVLNSIGYLAHSTLHLIHADELIEVLQNILNGPFFRNITSDVLSLHLFGISTTTDEMGEDILCRLVGQMTVSESIVLGLHLIFEEA